MINSKDLNNKVYIDGTIINSVRQKFHKPSAEQIVYFVVAVKRQDYPSTYNTEPHNYFYCYASEKLMGGTLLDMIRNTYKMYDNVRVYGVLDNIPNQSSEAKEVNFRATHCYLSAISIIDIKPSEKLKPNTDKEIALINNVRKTFGTDIEVTVSEDAFDKDYFGLEQEDLPDY